MSKCDEMHQAREQSLLPIRLFISCLSNHMEGETKEIRAPKMKGSRERGRGRERSMEKERHTERESEREIGVHKHMGRKSR